VNCSHYELNISVKNDNFYYQNKKTNCVEYFTCSGNAPGQLDDGDVVVEVGAGVVFVDGVGVGLEDDPVGLVGHRHVVRAQVNFQSGGAKFSLFYSKVELFSI
jgi:hypothetical protein